MATIVLSALFPAVDGAPSRWAVDVKPELAEGIRTAALGQRNCVEEAATASGGQACPHVETGVPTPSHGIRMLDAYAATVTVSFIRLAVVSANDPGNTRQGTGNWARETGLPDFILPGPTNFEAWLGVWSDEDADHVLEVEHDRLAAGDAQWGLANEWVPNRTASVVSYVEPGARPAPTSWERPHATGPDIRYTLASDGYGYRYGAPGPLMLDGSLLGEIKISTVSDAWLAPSPEGDYPFTPGPDSLVDIDIHPAVAAGPIVELYAATLAPLVTDFMSPSVGYCPDQCRPGPVRLGATPISGPSSEIHGLVWSPYPREWAADSDSSAANRIEAYRDGYAGWVDLLPLTGLHPGFFLTQQVSPLAGGKGSNGGPTAAPGAFTFEVWTGLWKDLDGDGFVGTALQGDPHEGGSRPIADDYRNARGEFFGVVPESAESGTFVWDGFWVTLVPDTDWGAEGVYVIPYSGLVIPLYYSDDCRTLPPITWIDGRPSCAGFDRNHVTGSEPIRIRAESIPNGGSTGQFSGKDYVYMPTGSPGFRICTEDLMVRHASHGFEVLDTVWDCDAIEPWART
ncbi:MAG TPA: hypothetical protein VM889_07720 [Candidatus Thermoplasmatota archaeon]|nr:hypothetical protein [Candidatus Thermoplasmatota archaeon]